MKKNKPTASSSVSTNVEGRTAVSIGRSLCN